MVLKCLEKDPNSYTTAQALADDLNHYLAREPIVCAAGSLERAVKWVRRCPTQAAAVALGVMVVGLAAVAGVIGWFWTDAVAVRHAAEDARGEADIQRDRADAVLTQYRELKAARPRSRPRRCWRWRPNCGSNTASARRPTP